MKKKIIFLLLLTTIVLLPTKINAANISTSLSCPSSANVGNTISCTVKVTSDTHITGVAAKYNLKNLTYVSFTASSGFSVYSSSASGFAIGNTSGKKGTFTIGVIKLKVKGAGSITLNGIDISDINDYAHSQPNKTANIRMKSTNNNLKGLTLPNGTLSPAFSANTTKYTSTINAGSITINATKGDNYQKISGTGKKTLKYGTNTFNIVVTSESGAKKTYTITIKRPDNRSKNNNLKSLSSNQGTISFNKNTTSYNLNVDANVTSIKINAALENSKASFVKGYGPRTVNLNYGKNAIQVKVKAENDSIKTYTINVNRKDDRSTNNYLKELTLDNGNITFNKNNLEYTTTVYYDVTKINVVAIPEDSQATVKVNNPDLLVGNNVITIVVTSENKQTRTYKVIVTRLSAEEKMSDNNNISKLEVLGHDIDFKTDVLEYDLTIKDEYALVFEITLEDTKASYVIEGNKDLKDGSLIKVIVTSESGQKKEYKFNVKKERVIVEEKNNSNVFIYATIGFVLGIVLTIIIVTVKNKRSSSKLN